MANQWFRSWHGAPTDPKWLAIGRKCSLAPGMVFAITWALMDRASQAAERGSFAGYDADEIAAFMGCDEQDVRNVIDLMIEKGMVKDDAFTKWAYRQPQRDDGAAERAKAWREREKDKQNNAERIPNATERKRTLDKDKDTDKEPSKEGKGARAREPFPEKQFQEFWDIYPNKVGKPKARSSFEKAMRNAAWHEIISGLQRYIAKTDDRPWCNPATWLNQERWLDEPAPPPKGASPPNRGHSLDEIAAAMHGHQRRLLNAN
jgi:hypothetical protein